MTSIFLMAMTKFFQNIFEIVSKIFFSQPQIDFRTQKNFFEKKFIKNLIFCVYNVVLDILILDFFSFSLHKFFQKRLKLLFLLYDMFLYALVNVW